jgi:hypothetical protein
MATAGRFLRWLLVIVVLILAVMVIFGVRDFLYTRFPAGSLGRTSTSPNVVCCNQQQPAAPAAQAQQSTPAPAKGSDTGNTATVTDCGPWSLEGDVLVFKGNSSQDVCQIGQDLVTVRAGTTLKFTRSSSFTLAICAATVTNDQGDAWTFTDCDQANGIIFPAGAYTISQPNGYSNGGFK